MSLLHGLATRALRRMDPEAAHRLTLRALEAGLGPRLRGSADPVLETRLGPLRLPNPVGLAAGFDKNGEVPGAMLAAGFGFVECGTVTPLPQSGRRANLAAVASSGSPATFAARTSFTATYTHAAKASSVRSGEAASSV